MQRLSSAPQRQRRDREAGNSVLHIIPRIHRGLRLQQQPRHIGVALGHSMKERRPVGRRVLNLCGGASSEESCNNLNVARPKLVHSQQRS